MRAAAVFALALALRWGYALAVFLTMGEAGLKGPDSERFLVTARDFAAAIAEGRVSGWDWLGPELSLMPLFTWWIALHAAVFGTNAALGLVLAQGVIDAATCLLAGAIARTFDERLTVPAALAAAILPTPIVLSGLVYTDTLFAFIATLALLAAIGWIRSSSRSAAVVLGAALGTALLVRPVIAGWALVLLPALICLAPWRKGWRSVRQIALAAAIAAVLVSPVLLRNHFRHDSIALTPQGGFHLAYWIVPLVREAKDGTPWPRGVKEVEARAAGLLEGVTNPFLAARRLTDFGREELERLGVAAVARAWLRGAAINLGAPALVMAPPVAALPRRGFYETPGDGLAEKALAWLFGGGASLFGWLVVLGLAGVLAWRAVQLVGLATLFFRRANLLPLLCLLGWCAYVLAASGPVASPKYRLPLEPVLAILAAAGWARLRGFYPNARRSDSIISATSPSKSRR